MKILLTLLIAAAVLAAHGDQVKVTPISQFPNVPSMAPGYLFLIANPGVGNLNISYNQFYLQLANDPNFIAALQPNLNVTTVSAAAINNSQFEPVTMNNAQNVFTGSFLGNATTASSAGTANAGTWTANPLYGRVVWTLGQSSVAPDTWLLATGSNGVQVALFQFAPEGHIILSGGITMGGGIADNNQGASTTSNSFQLPVFLANTNSTLTGNGSAVTRLNASSITTGKVPTNNLPIASTSQLGVVIPDGTTITINPSGVITSIAGGGTGSSNVNFYPSPTITFTLVGTSNQFNLVNGSVTSNNFGGLLDLSQVHGALTAVTASSPLASSGGTAPTISISLSTGTGSAVLSNGPAIVNPTITGYISGAPGMDGAGVTNQGLVASITPGQPFNTGVVTNPTGNVAWTISLKNPTGSGNSIVLRTNASLQNPTISVGTASNVTLIDSTVSGNVWQFVNTNGFSGNTFPMGRTNYFLVTSAEVDLSAVSLMTGGKLNSGELMIQASNTDITVTNPRIWFPSDGLSSRTVSNGNRCDLVLRSVPGLWTNLDVQQYYHP